MRLSRLAPADNSAALLPSSPSLKGRKGSEGAMRSREGLTQLCPLERCVTAKLLDPSP